ncbi:hypothetical protein MMC17_006147 [Xylographa soralifera]|nr:hypothetical protein [Xylographa soralifera]
MSRIVDDAGNLQQFTAAVTNVLASFGQCKNYGHPARGETQSSTASIVQTQPSIAQAMNSHPYTPGSPSTPPPPYTAQGIRDASSATLPSSEVNQVTSQIINNFPSVSSDYDRKPDMKEASFKSMGNGSSAKPEFAINKHLDSPQLTGLRAPPPTPETWAHKTPPTGPYNENRLGDDPLEEELAKEDLLISHIEKHMKNKPVHTGLGESMYAYRRPSYLANEAGHTQYTHLGRDVSPTSRREREKSFERLSFVVASASKAELLSKINAQSMIKSDNSGPCQAVATPETLEDNKEVLLQPPQLRLTAPSSVRSQTVKGKQTQVELEKIAPTPSLEPCQPVKMKQFHGTLEANTPVLSPIPAPGQSAKDVRVNVRSEKIPAVLPPKPVPGQPAKGERVHKNLEKAAAEPPIVAFKAGLQTFLDKYGARNKATTLKLNPEQLERTVVPTSKSTQSSESAENHEAIIGTPSHIKREHTIPSDVVLLQEPKSVIQSTSTVNDKPNLSPNLKVNSKLPSDFETTEPLADPVKESNLRPITPLRAIAVSQKDIPSTGKDKIPHVPSTRLPTITPASGNFEDLSPQTARYVLRSKTPNIPADKLQSTDDTYTTYWGRFPQPERRDKPVARVRRVIISGLPVPSSTKFVASLVYGGLVEHIVMKSGGTAEVLFVKPDDCSRFCDDNKNGLVYGKEVYESDKARELFVLVKAHADVDVVGGKMEELISKGTTRCVRVVWADLDYTTHDLWKLAEGKTRKVEHIVDDTKTVEIDTDGKKTTKECRTITFRFCKMQDADNFCASLRKDMDWEHCNIAFAPDPCATTTGIHLQD